MDHAKLPYEVPPLPKPFADYEWDDSYPGSFKPGTRGENQDLDVVLEQWKDRENPACVQLPQDALWQVCFYATALHSPYKLCMSRLSAALR